MSKKDGFVAVRSGLRSSKEYCCSLQPRLLSIIEPTVIKSVFMSAVMFLWLLRAYG